MLAESTVSSIYMLSGSAQRQIAEGYMVLQVSASPTWIALKSPRGFWFHCSGIEPRFCISKLSGDTLVPIVLPWGLHIEQLRCRGESELFKRQWRLLGQPCLCWVLQQCHRTISALPNTTFNQCSCHHIMLMQVVTDDGSISDFSLTQGSL